MKKIKVIIVALISVFAITGCEAKVEFSTSSEIIAPNSNETEEYINDVDSEEQNGENEEYEEKSEDSNAYVSETIGIKFVIPDGFNVTTDTGEIISISSEDTACIVQFIVNPDSTSTLDDVTAESIASNLTSLKYVIDEIPDLQTSTMGGEKWTAKGIMGMATYNDMPVLVTATVYDPGTGTLVFTILTILQDYIDTYSEILTQFDSTILSI